MMALNGGEADAPYWCGASRQIELSVGKMGDEIDKKQPEKSGYIKPIFVTIQPL
jgi:hypothetical protein